MAKTLKVNLDTCIGCGTCVAIADQSFKLEADGKSHPVSPPGDPEEKVKEAIESCPVDAITWDTES